LQSEEGLEEMSTKMFVYI